jgi:hypothetical protein
LHSTAVPTRLALHGTSSASTSSAPTTALSVRNTHARAADTLPLALPGATASQRAAANLIPEDRLAAALAEQLVAITPDHLLLSGTSSVTPLERRLLRVTTLSTMGTASLRKGISCLRIWISYAETHGLLSATTIDADVMQLCIRAASSTSKGSCGGNTTPHSLACGFRWLADGACMPAFASAKEQTVRDAFPPYVGNEPAFAPMWEVTAFVGLLHIAVRYRGPCERIVRASAAGAFVLAAASLRLVDGLRSAPPHLVPASPTPDAAYQLADCLASQAVITKGASRRVMRPFPWRVPLVSPDPDMTDTEMQSGLLEAFALLPDGAPSMFMSIVNAAGDVVSLPSATETCDWGSERSSDYRLSTAIAFLFTLPPISLSKPAAKEMASRKHAARHVFPELGRVGGIGATARDELGYWKGTAGRLGRFSNRYSREGERILQSVLREYIMRHIRSRLAVCSAGVHSARPPLEYFAATVPGISVASHFSVGLVNYCGEVH